MWTTKFFILLHRQQNVINLIKQEVSWWRWSHHNCTCKSSIYDSLHIWNYFPSVIYVTDKYIDHIYQRYKWDHWWKNKHPINFPQWLIDCPPSRLRKVFKNCVIVFSSQIYQSNVNNFSVILWNDTGRNDSKQEECWLKIHWKPKKKRS